MNQGRCLTIVEGRDSNHPMMLELIKAAEKAGWVARLLRTLAAESVAENKFKEYFSDYVIWRGFSGPEASVFSSERIIAYLNSTDCVTVNTHVVGGLSCTSNKFFQHGLFALDDVLAKHTLPMYRAMSRERVLKLVEQGKVKYPFVLKPEWGTRGVGILLVRDEKDIPEDVTNMSVEPYVDSTYNWRVFVLDGKPLGVMRKKGDPDDEANFKAKCSGRTRCNEDNPRVNEILSQLAVRAAKVSGLDYTGVDLIQDDKTGNFYVLETNFAGGWQNGFYEATGVYVPDEIMKFFERKYQERVSR